MMVHVEHISQRFGENWALKDISFSLEKGDFLFLTGPSGAGKTTLLQLLYGALPLRRGKAQVSGISLDSLSKSKRPLLRRKIGVVFQDFKILPERTVFHNVAMALEVRGTPKQTVEKRVRAIVRAVGLEKRTYTTCKRLSGGEQQRVAIARSMVSSPEMILADEPTGNLDTNLTQHLLSIFKQFNSFGTTIIMATHSQDVLSCVPDTKILHIEEGRIVSQHGLLPHDDALEGAKL